MFLRYLLSVDRVWDVIGTLRSVSFVPSSDLARSRSFYKGTLGLSLLSDDGFALHFSSASGSVRVVAAGDFVAQDFTILGWESGHIDQDVAALGAKGVEFIRYEQMDQDELHIWTSPGGSRVAWFKDPDGNVLSLTSEE